MTDEGGEETVTVSGDDDLVERSGSGWGRRSRWVDLNGPVHYLDFGGPVGGPVVVAVHGLGGSALNWLALAPLLADRCRMLAPDLAGHGLTVANGRGTTVGANRLLLHRFIEAVPGGPVILMGNSMGGMISLLEAGIRPETTAGLVLLDAASPFVPALPHPLVAAVFAAYTTPLVGRALMTRHHALPAETMVGLVLRLCCVDPSRVPEDVVAEHVRMALHRATLDHVERNLLYAARSVIATAGVTGGRGYRAAIRAIRAPGLVVHGERDRLIPVSASRALVSRHPSWQLAVLPRIGHLPQLEAAEETAEVILRWFDTTGWAAVQAATHPLVNQA